LNVTPKFLVCVLGVMSVLPHRGHLTFHAVFWVVVQHVCSISVPLSLALSLSSPAQPSLSYQVIS